ncbi:MAG: lipoate--protein ligase family protein [Gemmataceae bacterium]|nr:lipoate--protein ligase family protein [Gemmataceae bacterium]
MTLLDLTLPTPAENLALDEALLLAAEADTGGEVLRLWESPSPVVVVGAGGSVAVDVDAAACGADGVPVLRRASGGGTVVVGPGCLCLAVVLRTDHAPGLDLIGPSARWVMGRVLNALRPVVPDATIEGISDLAVGGRKFSGSAQQRKRRHFLHHATLLSRDFDLSLIPRYLRPPERQPAYRAGRPHAAFVAALPADTATLKRLLVEEWRPAGEYGPVPLDAVREQQAEKYGREEWNRRR